MQLENGMIAFDRYSDGVRLSLARWSGGQWEPLELKSRPDGYGAAAEGFSASLAIEPDGGDFRYRLAFKSERLTRIQLKLTVRCAEAPFHVIPGNIMGDNNLHLSEPGHFPNLTHAHPGNISCAPYWEFRADRAPLPVSLLCFEGGVAGISIQPYGKTGIRQSTSREGFCRNGLFSELGLDVGHGCGVTLGYRNLPCTFLNKDDWGVPTEHLLTEGEAVGFVFMRMAQDRREVFRVMERLYPEWREKPCCPKTAVATEEALVHAFLQINWSTEKEHFQNLGTRDYKYPYLWGWRTLAEIGWTGGGVIGYPLLAAGRRTGCAEAVEKGLYVLDWVARAYNEKSGLLWDVCGKREGQQTDWWWNAVHPGRGEHFAYTNGSAAYYLAKAYLFEQQQAGVDHPEWLETLCRQLDTICELQLEDGGFGYTYHADRKAISDPDGFAGCWFVPALALAHRITGNKGYLAAARRGAEFYHGFVKSLNCWGTPMDTRKATDQEGNLAFIRGAAELHRLTGAPEHLAMLEDGAHYEYLWRYGFRARPEYAPLRGSHWNSCGGSLTSTSNPHVHPMGIFVSRDLAYLAEQTGSAYHRQRMEDGLCWGINTAALYPETVGYGKFGVLTERFCPSDGFTADLNPDGTPTSIWYSYNGWAAAAVLEGLTEALYGGYAGQ